MDDQALGSEDLPRLVREARKGDRAAMRVLSQRACTLALRTTSVLMGSDDSARDVSQDVAVDVMRGLDRLRDPSAFDAWTHRISSRHAHRALRRRAVRRRREQPLPTSDDALPPDDREPGHADRVATRSAVAAALSELPANQQIAVSLRYVHDLSDLEIAKALNCKEGTVHSLLSRARATLRSSRQLDDLRPVIQGGAG